MVVSFLTHLGIFAAVEKLPFEDDSFDVAMSSLVLHHLPCDLLEGSSHARDLAGA